MALIYGKQITGSIVSASIATASYALTASYVQSATTATRIQSGSITASIAPSSGGVFNISSGSTNLVYISGNTGNMGVRGSVSASGLYATTIGSGTGTSVQAETIYGSNVYVSTLLSIETITSTKAFVSLDAGAEAALITYNPSSYYGIVIDAVAYAPNTDDTLTFRTTLSNTATKIGPAETAVLSSTNQFFSSKFLDSTYLKGLISSPLVLEIRFINNLTSAINIRPMYRLVKQAEIPES